MNIHKNARLTPRGREILIARLERGEHPGDIAVAMGVSVSTVYKWRRRYRRGFPDRPLRSPFRRHRAIKLSHARRMAGNPRLAFVESWARENTSDSNAQHLLALDDARRVYDLAPRQPGRMDTYD